MSSNKRHCSHRKYLTDLYAGPNNSPDNLPSYCPPLPTCQDSRLSGGTCPAQGAFEPVLCDAGWYCPSGGTQRIQCPEGSFCPHGVSTPIKCSFGSRCGAGSVRDMNLLPLGILILVDVILITLTIMANLRERYKRSSFRQKKKENKAAFLAKGAGRFQKHPYQEIDDDGYPGFNNDEHDFEMDAQFLNPRRVKTGFEHIGNLDRMSVIQQEIDKDDGGQKTDLQLFIQSLSKCLGATKLGLSFEFQDLAFKPPKSNKKILDQVSGTIHAGSLWAVMGASGAGKCTFDVHAYREES